MSTITASDFMTRIVTPLLVAAVIAVFTFSASRAGHEDLARVEQKAQEDLERVHMEIAAIEAKLENIESVVVQIRIEQARFMGEIAEQIRRNGDR